MKRKKPKKTKKDQKNSLRNKIKTVFMENPHKQMNYKQVSARMGISDKGSRDLVNTILLELIQKSIIEETNAGKYKLNPDFFQNEALKSPYVTGTVDMKQTGKAYVICDEGGEDVFISANNTYHALHGDKIKVHLFPKRKDRKLEGRIIEIIKRAKTQFVGVVQVYKNFAFLLPDSRSMPVDIFIPKSELGGAINGQKAIAKITDWPDNSKNPFGEITDVLGFPGDHEVEMKSILADRGFPLAFPDHVEREAEKIPTSITDAEIKKRRDFRNIPTLTIDPKDAKDFDDGLSVRKLENGNWEIGVHIADVSHYVKPNTALDQEAFRRGTSIYLVDRVIPMLPEKLSNNVCSLRADDDKLCFSAVFEMDENAKVIKEWFGKTIIRSKRRFNYDEVQQIIDSGKGEMEDEIVILHRLATKLREERFRNGSINFETEEVKFVLDDEGKPVSVYIREYKDSNKLVEDFMLLANRKVAGYIGRKRGRQQVKTFVYRIHDTPNQEKLQTFTEFLRKLGYKLNTTSHKTLAKSFNELFKQISGKGEQNMIETIAIRTMAKAEYSTDNIGHYGLAFRYYSHFTSPIRRYPDLIVHRLLERYLEGKPSVDQSQYEEICVHSSEMERKAVEAERDSVKYKQAEYLLDKIGQQFEGLISGVSKWGIFVELIESKCEGMVRLQDLEDDFYYLDEENYQVLGQRYGQQYKLGDRVRIVVKRIDLSKKQMDFEIVNKSVSF